MLPNDPHSPTDADFGRLEERLLRTVDARQAHRRHRHLAVLAASAVLLVAGGSATAWVTMATPELRSLSAYCYGDASTDSAFTQAGSPSAPVGSIDPVDDAVAKCAAVWNVDFFTSRSGSAATAGPEAQTAATTCCTPTRYRTCRPASARTACSRSFPSGPTIPTATIRMRSAPPSACSRRTGPDRRSHTVHPSPSRLAPAKVG